MLFAFLLMMLCQNGLAASVKDFANWKPDPQKGITYCESVRGTGSQAGIACGAASFNKMKKYDSALYVQNQFSSTLGLLNIGWISKAAYSTQRDFYQTCKPYFVRLYDGFYKNFNAMRCVTGCPDPDGVDPACDDTSNTIMKSGSGYCMSEPVCGAEIPILFLGSYNLNGSSNYVWGAGTYGFQGSGPQYGRCYGYALKKQSKPLEATILANTQ